jgi:hypothetical protein
MSTSLAMLTRRARKRSIERGGHNRVLGALKEKEMRSLVRSIGIAAGILVLAGVQNASAQIAYPVDFTTSFPFTVGAANLPAGSYTISPDDDNTEMILLTGAHTSVFFQTQSRDARQTPPKTEVVFNRYGDKYVLKDIWVQGETSGAETIAAEGERHLSKLSGSKSEQRVAARKTSNSSKVR